MNVTNIYKSRMCLNYKMTVYTQNGIRRLNNSMDQRSATVKYYVLLSHAFRGHEIYNSAVVCFMGQSGQKEMYAADIYFHLLVTLIVIATNI